MSTPYQIEVARTVGEVEALREAWEAMPSRIDADFDFFLQFMRIHSDFVLRPHVIALKKGDRVSTIVPGRLERQSLKVRIGYKHLTLSAVNQITIVGHILGEDTKEAAAEAIKSIQTSLRRGEADVAFFHHVDSEKHLHRIIESVGGPLTRDYFKESEESWRTQIPSSYDDFLKGRSSNTRYNIKRYSKRLLQASPGKVQHKIFQDIRDIEVVFSDCEKIAEKSYQRGIGVGFANNEATRQLFTMAAVRGWLRSYILYIDGRARAFWNGFLHQGTFVIWDTAYDAELSELRPGMYLLQKLIEDLCTGRLARELDFGPGPAQYKREMSDSARLRVSEFLFAPTVKGISANALRTPPLALSWAAKWVLKQSGFFDKVRKVVRSRAAPTDSGEDSMQEIPAAGARNDT